MIVTYIVYMQTTIRIAFQKDRKHVLISIEQLVKQSTLLLFTP